MFGSHNEHGREDLEVVEEVKVGTQAVKTTAKQAIVELAGMLSGCQPEEVRGGNQ